MKRSELCRLVDEYLAAGNIIVRYKTGATVLEFNWRADAGTGCKIHLRQEKFRKANAKRRRGGADA